MPKLHPNFSRVILHENLRHITKWLLLLDAITIIAVGSLVWSKDVLGYRQELTNYLANSQPITSRQVLEYTESLIRVSKPTPPESAREYAYVASAYEGVLETNGRAAALSATQAILDALYPNSKNQTASQIKFLYSQAKLTIPKTDPNSYTTVQVLKKRMTTDGHDLVWDGVIPTAVDNWVKTTDKNPLAPRAGDWQRWQVSGDMNVPPPPQYGSSVDAANLQAVRDAVADRDAQWIAKINFWGGTPGTNAPSGIWQDQFYKVIKPDLNGTADQRDRSYAYAQKVLAQTMADAFIECWHVKYIYWTARPDQRDPSIKTAMPDPLFPSYVSGHSTISKAAAEVLAVMAPAHAAEWRQMAVDARDSRLYAGIHFPVDNMVGFTLGQTVANQVIAKRKLSRVF